MSESDSKYYIGLVFCFVFCVVVALVAYDIGYVAARDKYQTPTKFRCHEEVVYRWSGGYWEKLGQACKSEQQLKEKP